MEETGDLFAGYSGVHLPEPEFNLGDGLILRTTYAHLTGPMLMAFAPPTAAGHHPAPWRAARGGLAFDIHAELKVPAGHPFAGRMSQVDVAWLVGAMLRVAIAPWASLAVVSDHAFSEAATAEAEPILRPLETVGRIITPSGDLKPEHLFEPLGWISEAWKSSAQLLLSNTKFDSAFRAFDAATLRGSSAASLLALWGALEQLFAPSPGELRYRVSAFLAAYLESPGEDRYDLYQQLLGLYNQRSKAAHTASHIESGPLLKSYVIARNAMVRIMSAGAVPTQEELERLLFGATPESEGSDVT